MLVVALPLIFFVDGGLALTAGCRVRLPVDDQRNIRPQFAEGLDAGRGQAILDVWTTDLQVPQGRHFREFKQSFIGRRTVRTKCQSFYVK